MDKIRTDNKRMEAEKDIKYKCDACGRCCKYMKMVMENKDKYKGARRIAIDRFPYKWKEDGSCEKLVNNKCEVYSKRPLLCNIEKMYEVFFKGVMSKKEYFEKVKKSCNMLKLWNR
jgi:Fe-S-cluster containining protein